MAIEFNKTLKMKAEKQGFQYIDIMNDIINPETKIVYPKYIRKNMPTDVHLEMKQLIEIYHSKFKHNLNLNFANEINDIITNMNAFYCHLKRRFNVSQ